MHEETAPAQKTDQDFVEKSPLQVEEQPSENIQINAEAEPSVLSEKETPIEEP